MLGRLWVCWDSSGCAGTAVDVLGQLWMWWDSSGCAGTALDVLRHLWVCWDGSGCAGTALDTVTSCPCLCCHPSAPLALPAPWWLWLSPERLWARVGCACGTCQPSQGGSCKHLSILVTFSSLLIDHAASLHGVFFFQGFPIIMTPNEADYVSHKEH